MKQDTSDKVYCRYCKWFAETHYGYEATWDKCENKEATKIESDDKAERINKNNDCKYYEYKKYEEIIERIRLLRQEWIKEGFLEGVKKTGTYNQGFEAGKDISKQEVVKQIKEWAREHLEWNGDELIHFLDSIKL